MFYLLDLLRRPDAATAVFISSVGLLAMVVVMALNPPASSSERANLKRKAKALPELALAPRLVREGQSHRRQCACTVCRAAEIAAPEISRVALKASQ